MKVIIASANGYGNAGDDICAMVSKMLVKEVFERPKIRVTAPPFDETIVTGAEAIVLGGGGIIYDANKANMDNYLQYVNYGLSHDAITIGLGLGEQGIVTKEGEKTYKAAFEKMDLLTVRSKMDAERLQKIGVKNVEATQDLAFSFDYSKYATRYERIQKYRDKSPWRRKPKLGTVISNQEHLVTDLKLAYSKVEKLNALHFKNSLENNIQKISQIYNVTIITQSRDDLEMAEMFKTLYGVSVYSYKNARDLHKLLNTYASQDIILSQRFHGIVFSLMIGVPVIGLGYEGQKQYKLLKDMGLDRKLIMYHRPKKLNLLLSSLGEESYDVKKQAITLNKKNKTFIKQSASKNLSRLQQVYLNHLP